MSTKSSWEQTFAGQPAPGAKAERTRTTTMRDVEMFTEITGDRNPIHYDLELAANSPFGGLIVQGGVTTGLLNAVVAEDLPGPGTVFLETNWRFVKAVRVGEAITKRHSRARPRGQTDLQAGNNCAKLGRRNVRGRHRNHLHDAAAAGRDRPREGCGVNNRQRQLRRDDGV